MKCDISRPSVFNRRADVVMKLEHSVAPRRHKDLFPSASQIIGQGRTTGQVIHPGRSTVQGMGPEASSIRTMTP